MVEFEVPKIDAKRRLRWVRVIVLNGIVSCPDDAVRRKVLSLTPPGGFCTSIPDPDWEISNLAELWLHARVIRKTSSGTYVVPPDVVM